MYALLSANDSSFYGVFSTVEKAHVYAEKISGQTIEWGRPFNDFNFPDGVAHNGAQWYVLECNIDDELIANSVRKS